MSKLQGATERLWRLERGLELESWVQLERARGVWWRAIGDEIQEATGVQVSTQTLLNWYGEAVAA